MKKFRTKRVLPQAREQGDRNAQSSEGTMSSSSSEGRSSSRKTKRFPTAPVLRE